jgi:hypothetical protein
VRGEISAKFGLSNSYPHFKYSGVKDDHFGTIFLRFFTLKHIHPMIDMGCEKQINGFTG